MESETSAEWQPNWQVLTVKGRDQPFKSYSLAIDSWEMLITFFPKLKKP